MVAAGDCSDHFGQGEVDAAHADILRHAVTLTFDSLTLNVCLSMVA